MYFLSGLNKIITEMSLGIEIFLKISLNIGKRIKIIGCFQILIFLVLCLSQNDFNMICKNVDVTLK